MGRWIYVETKPVRRLVLVALVAFAIAVVGASMTAQTPNADRWSKLYAANDLGLEGSKPFHLQMSFQMYSMAGGAEETGTIEEWWYSPQDNHMVIHTPSFNQDSDVPDAFDEKTAREKYFVTELLYFALRPVPKHSSVGPGDVSEFDRSFGKASLDCLQGKPVGPAGMTLSSPTICTEKKTDKVRVVLYSDGERTYVRNSIGTLYDVSVALDMQISYLDRQAITGKVTSLTGLAPKSAEPQAPTATLPDVPADKPAGPPAVAKRAQIAGGVIAGSRTKYVVPEYPLTAKFNHMSGLVFLRAVISKDGSIEHLIPLASADPSFTKAAMDAVKQWMYKPYLLNGEPVEVDTTITVNFTLHG